MQVCYPVHGSVAFEDQVVRLVAIPRRLQIDPSAKVVLAAGSKIDSPTVLLQWLKNRDGPVVLWAQASDPGTRGNGPVDRSESDHRRHYRDAHTPQGNTDVRGPLDAPQGFHRPLTLMMHTVQLLDQCAANLLADNQVKA